MNCHDLEPMDLLFAERFRKHFGANPRVALAHGRCVYLETDVGAFVLHPEASTIGTMVEPIDSIPEGSTPVRRFAA